MVRSLLNFLVHRNSKIWAAVWLVGASFELSSSRSLLAAQDRVVDPRNLPRFAPVATNDALSTFRIRKGFRLELVAAEPLVIDPIALAFDEDGRLFVLEMSDYPERAE